MAHDIGSGVSHSSHGNDNITPLVVIGNAENFFILMILLKTRAYKKYEFSNTDLGLFAHMQLI